MTDHIRATLTDLSHRPFSRGAGTEKVTLLLSNGLAIRGVPEIVGDADHVVIAHGESATLVALSAVLGVQYQEV